MTEYRNTLSKIYLMLRLVFHLDMELLMNADFESAAVSENWLCPGCTMASHSNDTYHGNRSVLVTDR